MVNNSKCVQSTSVFREGSFRARKPSTQKAQRKPEADTPLTTLIKLFSFPKSDKSDLSISTFAPSYGVLGHCQVKIGLPFAQVFSPLWLGQL